MVSQFVSTHDLPLLGSIDFDFPEGTHAIGRLDRNSEGLLLLTTNKKITALLFESKTPHSRTYLVQLNNIITDESIEKLACGISISADNGGTYITQPCVVKRTVKPSYIEDLKTIKPLHRNVVNSWITITLTEGRFHQVRKMVRALKHKCLRLVRISIEDIELGDMSPGSVKEVEESYFFEKLKL